MDFEDYQAELAEEEIRRRGQEKPVTTPSPRAQTLIEKIQRGEKPGPSKPPPPPPAPPPAITPSPKAQALIERIVFDSFNLADSETLSHTLTVKTRLTNELKRGPLTVKELVESLLDLSENTVRGTLNRYTSDTFVKLTGGKWGLMDYG